MPITPCFDPTTGASGGAEPAPSGGSLYDIPFGDPIDLTDGWTLYDPDNLIKSITFSGGFHTVIWNELLTGSNNYNWASGAATRAPRWYQPAQIDSTQLTSDDVVQNIFFMVTDNAAGTGRGDFANSVSHAMCANPTTTVATDIGAVGQHVTVLTTGADAAYFGVLTVNSAATTATGNPSRSMATSQYGGRHVGSACFTNLDASGYRLQNGSRNGNTFISAGVNLNWMVGLGIRSNTTTIAQDDQSLRFKIYRKSTKMDLSGVL